MTREEAIDMLYGMKADNLNLDDAYTKDKYDALEMAIQALSQEPKTGHWIQTNESFINQDGQFIYNFICSECESLSYFRKSNKKVIGANVCPNCGCAMVEPQERSKKE